MIDAGMDVARLNFSHGSVEEHAETARMVRDAANAAGRPVAILQDLPGPKMRIGQLVDDRVELETGSTVTFVCHEDGLGDARQISVAIPELADAVDPGEIVYLADGSVRLRVTAVRAGAGSSTARSSSAGPSPPARGSTSRARPSPPVGPRGRPGDAARGGAHRRRPRRAVLRASRRGRRGGAAPHPAAAHREDREAAGGRPRRRRSSRRPTASWSRAAISASSCRSRTCRSSRRSSSRSRAPWRARRSPRPRCSTRW